MGWLFRFYLFFIKGINNIGRLYLSVGKNLKELPRKENDTNSLLWGSVVTQRSSPQTAAENRTTFLSRGQPIRIQLPFSGRCSRQGDSSNHSFRFIGAPCVNDRTIKSSRENINWSSVVVVLFKIYEISSSSSKQVEQMWCTTWMCL